MGKYRPRSDPETLGGLRGSSVARPPNGRARVLARRLGVAEVRGAGMTVDLTTPVASVTTDHGDASLPTWVLARLPPQKTNELRGTG
jgi:hypothetical protein